MKLFGSQTYSVPFLLLTFHLVFVGFICLHQRAVIIFQNAIKAQCSCSGRPELQIIGAGKAFQRNISKYFLSDWSFLETDCQARGTLGPTYYNILHICKYLSWDCQGSIHFLTVHILLDNELECISSNASGYFCLQEKSSCVTGPLLLLAESYDISCSIMHFSNQP